MKKVVFTQDLGVERSLIEKLLSVHDLAADWSFADDGYVKDKDGVVAVSTAHVPLPSEILSQFPNLRVVSMSFTGYDHVDKDYCLKHSIPVYNVPAYSTDSVAELAVGLALSLLRQIPKGDNEVRKGNWNQYVTGIELAGKVCGVIGTGTIGCRLAELLAAFKCPLLGWSRTEKDGFKSFGGKYCSLEHLVSQSDLIFVTAALNQNTRGLLGDKEFALMKSNAFVVNVARGPLIERSSLIEAIAAGKIAGVGLDVYDVEPLSIDDELRSLDHSVLTPHVAYRTKEALTRKVSVTIENIVGGLQGLQKNRVI